MPTASEQQAAAIRESLHGDDLAADTVEHLTELLNQKNREIDELRENLQETENALKGSGHGWSVPGKLPKEQALPVPRLELFYERDDAGSRFQRSDPDWYSYVVKYRLIYRHLLDDIIAIPLGQTRINGGNGRRPIFDDGQIELPFRDGAHIASDMVGLKLPAFAVCDGVVCPIRPRKG